MNDEGYKLVDFHLYCPKCKHEKKDGVDEPCCDCLTEVENLNSSKPVKYEEK